ncbi:MAG TPA: amidohydrolase [Gemmatimonadales bacterium]|nr:amidohydrolase [Gemmatimonadales bacterium]
MWIPTHSQPTSGFARVGRVVTLDSGIQPADAVWWEAGRIRAVGRARDLAALVSPQTPSFDLPHAWITPGLVDGHTHFSAWALNRRQVQLAGAPDRETIIERVARATPVQGWIIGQGWDANSWRDPPERRALDRVQPGPVFLHSLDLHAAWLNTAALAAAGIDRDTPDPFGGRIVRDAAGEPTGLLQERAVELAIPALPVPPRDLLRAALLEAQAEAHRLGLTGIHNVESDEVYSALRALDADGLLRLRVLFHPPVASLHRLIAEQARTGEGSAWLTMGGVKLFLDGSLGTQTAWMLDRYEGSADRGLQISTLEQAREATALAAAAGIASAVHAIGDAAVRRALDLLAELPRASLPHRIEHLQCVHRGDLGRAAAAGVVASMQPAHLLTDIPLVDRHWGARGSGAYAFRSLAQRGTVLAFGSDAPVASLDPREGVYAAMARRGPDGSPSAGWYAGERLTFVEALSGYTRGNAVAGGVAARRGAVTPGFDADLVAWDVDPELEAGAVDGFRNARVRLTVVGGEVVMQS